MAHTEKDMNDKTVHGVMITRKRTKLEICFHMFPSYDHMFVYLVQDKR